MYMRQLIGLGADLAVPDMAYEQGTGDGEIVAYLIVVAFTHWDELTIWVVDRLRHAGQCYMHDKLEDLAADEAPVA